MKPSPSRKQPLLFILLIFVASALTLAQPQREQQTSERGLQRSSPAPAPTGAQETPTPANQPRLVVQVAHETVNQAIFSPDGRLMITAGDRSATLWDVATARELRRFNTVSYIASVAFSPDGRFVLTGETNVAVLWEVTSGTSVQRFDHVGIVMAVAFTRDGRFALTGGSNSQAVLWNLATGEPEQVYDGHTGCIRTAAISRDGRYLLTGSTNCQVGSADASARLWDLQAGKELRSFSGYERDGIPAGIIYVGFSPDSRFALFSIMAKTSRLQYIELASGRVVWDLPYDVKDAAFSPDGRSIATIVEMTRVLLLDPATGKEVSKFAAKNDGLADLVQSVAFSPDGQFLLTGLRRGSTWLWDVRSGQLVRRFEGQPNFVRSVHLSPDGRFILTEPNDPYIKKEIGVLWDIESGNVTRTFALDLHQSPIASHAAFSPDSQFILTSDNHLWNLSTGAATHQLRKYLTGMLSVAFSPDGRLVAIGDRKNKALLIDVATGQELRRFQSEVRQGYISDMGSLAFSPDGRLLLTGSQVAVTGSAILWDVASGSEVRRFDAPGGITTVAFSPDGRWVLTGQRDGALTLWEAAKGRPVWTQKGHKKEIESARFSSNGEFILSASTDGTARLWNAATGAEVQRFQGHAGSVHSAEFSPDGRFVLTGAMDFTTRLWETATGRELCRLLSFRDGNWVVVDPEGRFDTSNLDEIRDLHWVMPDDPFTPLPIEIFMRDYYEPRLLQRILAGERFKPVKSISELNRTQPNVRIASIEPQAGAPDKVSVTVEVVNAVGKFQRGGTAVALQSGAYDLRLFRDGQLVGSAPENGGAVRLDQTGKATIKFSNIKLPRVDGNRTVEFSAYAFNHDRIKSATDRKSFAIPTGLAAQKGRAYLITVGVNAYEQAEFDLSFAANDARRVQSVVFERLRQTGEYEEIVAVSLLSDHEVKNGKREVIEKTATKSNIKAVLDLLSGKAVAADALKPIANANRLREARPEDLVLLSFAGHGFADDSGNFYLVPFDTGAVKELKPTPAFMQRCLSSEELSQWLRGVDAGEMVMIVDACQSAASIEAEGFKPGPMGSRGLGQLAYDKGMRILTSTQADDVALESELIRQGLLTYALTRDGIEAEQADFKPQDRIITLAEWLAYGVARVPSLYEEVKKGELQSFGRGKRALVVASKNSRSLQVKKSLQRPALFDFARKKRDVTFSKLSAK